MNLIPFIQAITPLVQTVVAQIESDERRHAAALQLHYAMERLDRQYQLLRMGLEAAVCRERERTIRLQAVMKRLNSRWNPPKDDERHAL